MSRLPNRFDSRLTDGAEVVILILQSPFRPKKIPDTHVR
jgi:hypothetical protein